MNFRSSICRSDSKAKNPIVRVNAARCSLQNENVPFKRPRSSSLDFRARVSGSACKPRSSSEERKSELFGRNGNRKSSINLDAGKPQKEFRPLTDKTYQKKKLIELIEFLTEIGYPLPLSLAKLMAPSKKDFESIFQFLVRYFDPTFEMKRGEEDGPRILKTLCYPFIPTKSAFMYVARTSWPPLLGVLLYLMDNVKFALNIDESSLFYNPQVERPDEHAILLEYMFKNFIERTGSEEEEKEIYTKMIKARMPLDIDELERRKEELKEEIEILQNQVDDINALKDKSDQLDSEIQKYETFFVNMKEHKKKKEEACQKVLEEVTQKESELKGLQEILNEKLAVYDAQGYDGKKQLTYVENQKKELMEKLTTKKNQFRELQSECGEAEIQHREALDKGIAICDSFNQLYARITETAANVLNPLRNLKDPQIKGLCSNYNFQFPDCNMVPNQKCQLQWSNTRKTSLEEVKQKIDSANFIFKGLEATQNQKLHVLRMKSSEVAVNLKLAASEESQKEHELVLKEKQSLDDMKAVETECNEMIKKLDALQAETRKLEEENAEIKEKLTKLEKVTKEKEKMLDDYLIEQKSIFAGWLKDIEETTIMCQEAGEEIYTAVEKAITQKNNNEHKKT